MRLMTIILGAAALTTGALGPDRAWAAPDAACLRATLPPARQADFAREYRRNGLSRMPDLDDRDEPYLAACDGLDNPDRTGVLLAVIYLEVGASTVLREDFGVSQDDLEAAWRRLPAEAREMLAMTGRQLEGGAEPNDMQVAQIRTIVWGFTAQLGLGESARTHVYAYLMGKAYLAPLLNAPGRPV